MVSNRRSTGPWCAALLAAALTSGTSEAAVRSDFDGDGRADILWQNSLTTGNQIWFMNGAQIASVGWPNSAGRYRARVIGDFSGDRKADILWRHDDSGVNSVWLMDGATTVNAFAALSYPDTDWRVAATGDFNGDRRMDALWRHEALGQNAVWLMNGTVVPALALTAVPDLAWRAAGAGDLNGDGRDDILWRHQVLGHNWVWFMNGTTVANTGYLPTRPEREWKVAAVADFNGDARADVLWRHSVNGSNELWLVDGTTITATGVLRPMRDPDWRAAMVDDFNGDGRADILWHHDLQGTNQVWLMSGLATLARANLPKQEPAWNVAGAGRARGETLYVATLLPEGGAVTTASGTATLRLSPDERSGVLSLSFSGLTSAQTAAHIHGPAEPGQNAPPIFSLPEGTFPDLLWTIQATAGMTVADIVTHLKTGRLYLNVHSSMFPNGEIRGHFRVVPGSQDPPVPPNPPGPWPASMEEAGRMVEQATMGASPVLVSYVLQVGYNAFLEEQFTLPSTTYAQFVNTSPPTNDEQRVNALRSWLFINALGGPDQLRQRVTLALSQILVVSSRDIYDGPAMAYFADVLYRRAFGSFRTLLEEVTLNPAMGRYLDMVNNDRPNPSTGRTANENYARELLQLFSIGLFKLNQNGTLVLDDQGRPIPTYDQDVIENLARVFTGWTYAPFPGQPMLPHNPPNFSAPMVLYAPNHDPDAKVLFDGYTIPAGLGGAEDLRRALDAIFWHPNVGPFIGRQLIQHLVTSNPSPGYVARVAAAFNDNGGGVRGDMTAVMRAILLDVEARRNPATQPSFGRFREPILFITDFLRKMLATGRGYGFNGYADYMAQLPWSPPTVFSFFSPDFQVPGTSLFGPPLEIFAESTAARRSNFVNSLTPSSGNVVTVPLPSYAPTDAVPVTIDYGPWVALAGSPAQLVDGLDTRFMHRAMPADMKQRIIDAVAATSASSPITRVKTAIYLVATSAQYNVQR